MLAQITNAVSVDAGQGMDPAVTTQLLTALLTPILVWVVSKFPKVPRKLLPAIAPVFGIVIGWVLTMLTKAHLSTANLAIAGSAAVGVREVFNQWVTKRLKEPEPDEEEPHDTQPPK